MRIIFLGACCISFEVFISRFLVSNIFKIPKTYVNRLAFLKHTNIYYILADMNEHEGVDFAKLA